MIRLRARHTLVLALLHASCTVYDVAEADREIDTLRAEVAALRAAAGARLELDTMLSSVVADSNAIAVGLRVTTVRDILSRTASRYLTGVRLHLRPNVVVRESDNVGVRVGPLRVNAGTWELAVTILRVDALLSAEAIDVTVADSNRLDITVPVHVSEGTGAALIDFRWDAAAMTSVVCADFAVHETFTGYVEPRTYRMRGSFMLVVEDGGLVAKPVVHDRIAVSPRPTEASWARVREILREQNQIFNCGIAMSPSGMETMLRTLLTKGFRFSLPSSLIRAVPLPASIRDEVDVVGRRAAISIIPEPPELTAGWLWLRAAVRASAYGTAPIKVDAGR
jgi:hypothetical protein